MSSTPGPPGPVGPIRPIQERRVHTLDLTYVGHGLHAELVAYVADDGLAAVATELGVARVPRGADVYRTDHVRR